MSVNQDFGPRLRVWLHERLTERPDPYPVLDEVLSQLPTTPQRRHRWWPIGATSSGRFTMFSAFKLIAAAAIVALFGGFLATGLLSTPQADEPAPAAASESPSPITEDRAFPTGSYETQDGLTLGWGVYDGPVGGVQFSNVFDDQLQSQVIEINRDGTQGVRLLKMLKTNPKRLSLAI